MASSAQKESSTKNLDLCKFGVDCTRRATCRFTHGPPLPCIKIVDGSCTYPGKCKYAHPKGCHFNKAAGKSEGKSEVKPEGKSAGNPKGKPEGKTEVKTEVKPESNPKGKTKCKPEGKSEVVELSDEERMEMQLLETKMQFLETKKQFLELQLKSKRAALAKPN